MFRKILTGQQVLDHYRITSAQLAWAVFGDGLQPFDQHGNPWIMPKIHYEVIEHLVAINEKLTEARERNPDGIEIVLLERKREILSEAVKKLENEAPFVPDHGFLSYWSVLDEELLDRICDLLQNASYLQEDIEPIVNNATSQADEGPSFADWSDLIRRSLPEINYLWALIKKAIPEGLTNMQGIREKRFEQEARRGYESKPWEFITAEALTINYSFSDSKEKRDFTTNVMQKIFEQKGINLTLTSIRDMLKICRPGNSGQ